MSNPEATASGFFVGMNNVDEALGQPNAADAEWQPRRPTVEMLLLAGPTVIQMASYTLMQFIDTWMLSRVGPVPATAAANSGLLAFSVISLGVGVLSIVNTLVSQNFGQRDYPSCGRYLWQGLWFSLLFSLLIVPSLFIVAPMFRVFGHEPALAGMETAYLRIVLAATLIKLVGNSTAQFLLAVNRPNQVLIATLCGVTTNAVFAWMMIFGHGGFEAMGIRGAAWAQNIGVMVETGVLMSFALRPHVRKTFNVLDWVPRPREMKTLMVVGLPAGVQFVCDILAWSIFSVLVMNQFGTPAMAANSFVMRYMSVSFMPAVGISIAVTALVGRYIGMGRPDLAERRTHLGFFVTAGYMMSCGLAFFLGRNSLIGFFTKDPEILRIGSMLMVFIAVYQFFDALYIIYNGALRGAGDTFMPAVVTGVLNWGISVAGGFAVARLWPQAGPAGPWAAATLYGIALGLFIYLRFRRGAWKLIALEEDSPSARLRPGFDVVLPEGPSKLKTQP